MPMSKTTGNKIGTRIVIAAIVSIKHPTNKINKFASKRNTHFSLVTETIQAVSICAACVVVSSHAKIDAAVTINKTEAVVSIVSKLALIRLRKVIER